jgi:hypothetical protein
MPLVQCKECGKEVSTSATVCPYCGVPNPGVFEPCAVRVHRKSRFFGNPVSMHVYLDNREVGTLQNDQSVSINVDPGYRTITVRAFSFPTKEKKFKFVEGKQYTIHTYIEFAWIVIE